jgi:4-hydroxy-4-methyl-2-oxoglutarate aldolase
VAVATNSGELAVGSATEVRLPSGLSSATVHEAARGRGALPFRIKPVHPSFALEGPAFTVRGRPGDNLWIHRGVYAAAAGDVLVVDVGDDAESGYWGEILSRAALARGLGGLIINGGVRDLRELVAIGFPVFALGICIQGTTKRDTGVGGLEVPVRLGDVTVEPGDLVLGDLDGVVAVPAGEVGRVLAAAEQRVSAEEEMMRRIANGESTLTILGLE